MCNYNLFGWDLMVNDHLNKHTNRTVNESSWMRSSLACVISFELKLRFACFLHELSSSELKKFEPYTKLELFWANTSRKNSLHNKILHDKTIFVALHDDKTLSSRKKGAGNNFLFFYCTTKELVAHEYFARRTLIVVAQSQ